MAAAIRDLAAHTAAQDVAWSAADDTRRARLRSAYRAAGWSSCLHVTCPPWDCQATYVAAGLTLDDLDARWEHAGEAWHADGGTGAPVLDPLVRTAIADTRVGNPRTLGCFAAWIRGFDTAARSTEGNAR